MNKQPQPRNKKLPSAPPARRDAGAELLAILHALLERRHYLMPFIKEFNCIDNTLSRYFEHLPGLSIGCYKVQGFYRDEARRPARRKWVVEISKEEGV